MSRVGEHLFRCAGLRSGSVIWVDGDGPYEVDGEIRRADFFFHREKKAVDGSTIIRCKKWRR